MKLFLASAFSQIAELLPTKIGDLKDKRVIFIENASDVDGLEQDRWWLRIDREAFENLGCEIVDIDLRKVTPDELQKVINESNIIHFCGGSVFYLIDLIKKRGFLDIIVNAVKNDKIIYTGTSAGSMIVSSDLSVDKGDPMEKEIVLNIKDFTGLGLVDFLIMPHADNAEFSEGNKNAIKDISKYKTATFFLCDNQVIFVEGEMINLLCKK